MRLSKRSMTSPSRAERVSLRDETGTAALEFITVGLILLVPLVYLVLALASLQAGTFAVEGAARQAARGAMARSGVGRLPRAHARDRDPDAVDTG